MNTIARLLLTLPLVIPAACRDSSPATLTESPRRMSASSIEWHGLLGRGGDRVYSLAGRGVIGIPFLASAELHEGLDEFVRSWLEAHPVAVVVPVESYPFFSESTHFVYAWVSDDQAHLNLELVEGGYCRASLMVPTLRVQDRLVSPGEVDDFLKRIVEAETRAAAARAGIWEAASPEKRAAAGSIPPLGSAALSDIVAEAKAAAAEADPPPPSYDESTAEGELIRVADGDDPASSYAAFNELLRRAVDDSLSNAGFDSLVAKGLERQADSELAWSGHYAALLASSPFSGKAVRSRRTALRLPFPPPADRRKVRRHVELAGGATPAAGKTRGRWRTSRRFCSGVLWQDRAADSNVCHSTRERYCPRRSPGCDARLNRYAAIRRGPLSQRERHGRHRGPKHTTCSGGFDCSRKTCADGSDRDCC